MVLFTTSRALEKSHQLPAIPAESGEAMVEIPRRTGDKAGFPQRKRRD